MNHLEIFKLIIEICSGVVYFAISIFAFALALATINDGDGKIALTLGSLFFPTYWLPFLVHFIFTFKINKLFKNRNICSCPSCGTPHKTFNDKFNSLIGIKNNNKGSN